MAKMAKRVGAMWSPMGPTGPEGEAKLDSFSAGPGARLFPADLRSPWKKIIVGRKLLAEGLGLRGLSRVLDVKLVTTRGLLAIVSSHCEQVNQIPLKDLKPSLL